MGALQRSRQCVGVVRGYLARQLQGCPNGRIGLDSAASKGGPQQASKKPCGPRPLVATESGVWMTDKAKRTGAAVEAHYQFLTWLAPAIDRRAASCPRLSRAPTSSLQRLSEGRRGWPEQVRP